MQAFLRNDQWSLGFCAGYIVQPCRGLELEAIENHITGSAMDIPSLPERFFLPLFTESAEKCPIGIAFLPENGKQENLIRGLIRSIAFEDDLQKTQAARVLACRLAHVMTKRSSAGLFVVLAGSASEVARVLLWKFPAEESLQASVSASGITISLLQDAFSRRSNYFKAAMFEGTPATTSFWTGKVEDKQAKRRITEAADFWVAGFLSARPELTEGKGTKILAKALRETIKQTPSPQEKEAIVAVADVIKSQPERDFSLNEIAETYLSQEARQTFTKVIANSAVADIPFRVDAGVLEKEFKFQSITINSTFIVKGPLDEFDNVVTIRETDEPSIVEVTLRGTITSRTVIPR